MQPISGLARKARIPAATAIVAALACLAAPSATVNAATAPPKPTAKPAAAVTARPQAETPAGMSRTTAGLHAVTTAVVRQAAAASTATDTCSGPISPDTIYSCTSPSRTGTDTYTLTVQKAPDTLLIRVVPPYTGVDTLPITLTAPDGSSATCGTPTLFPDACAVSQAGTYKLKVANNLYGSPTTYTLAYTAVVAEASCPVADPSFSAPVVTGTVPVLGAGVCHELTMPAGHVLYVTFESPDDSLSVVVYNASGSQLCDKKGPCTLTGAGPYRVFVNSDYSSSGDTESYTLALNDITNPTGCLAQPQMHYDQLPVYAPDRCRSLTVSAAGSYQIFSYAAAAGAVFTSAGSPACTSYTSCSLAPGTYYFVAGHPSPGKFGVTFIAANESQGCNATADNGFTSGPVTGSFDGPGEELCLTLPAASGQSEFFLDWPTGSNPDMRVVDANGKPQCSSATFSTLLVACALSGTAPFRVILSPITSTTTSYTKDYRVLVNRTDSYTGCAAWPQSRLGGSLGVTVSLASSDDFKCLVIPAGKHSTEEMMDYSDSANTPDLAISVYDLTGTKVCEEIIGTSLQTCHYKSGVTYIALLTTPAPHGGTYHLVRSDISTTAKCATPTSTAVGGPSATFRLASGWAATCYQLHGAATDKFWVSVRYQVAASGQSPSAEAALLVVDSSGNVLCFPSYAMCGVTGSTDYQVVVLAANYAGNPITTHLDTWLVGTASGWAQQCQAHHFSFSAGTTWGPVNGTLTEKAAGYCAVIKVKGDQNFQIFGTDSASPQGNLIADVSTAKDWITAEDYYDICSSGGGGPTFAEGCNIMDASANTTVTAVLLLTPATAPTPVKYAMWGNECTLNCQQPVPLIKSVSPTTQWAGRNNKVVVTGSELTMFTPFALIGKKGKVKSGKPVAVNAAGTRLTVKIDTSHLAAGRYGVTVGDPSYKAGKASPGYLPDAYQVLKPQVRFTWVRPTRILNRVRHRVARHAVIRLRVTGAGRVPASAVAVAVELTVVNPARGGHLAAYPSGAARHSGSSLSFSARRAATSLAIVPVRHGKIALYNGSAGGLGLTADLVGYYMKNKHGLRFAAVASHRVLDTRRGLGARKARVAPHRAITFKAAGVHGVPAKGVAAVAIDVTAIGPAKAGHLIAYAAGTARRNVTDLSFAARQTTESLVIVPVRNRKVSLYNASGGRLNLTADVVGYFASGAGKAFHPVDQHLIPNARNGRGGTRRKVGARSVAVTRVAGVGGIPSKVSAVVLSVTVSGARRSGALTVYPYRRARPAGPNLVFPAKRQVSTLVIVPVVNGHIDFYNRSSRPVELTATLEGYYAA